jgi:hypothetical protein
MRRVELYELIRKDHEFGLSKREIARKRGVHRKSSRSSATRPTRRPPPAESLLSAPGASTLAQRTLDADVIEHHVNTLVTNVQMCVEQGIASLNDTTNAMLDADSGQLAEMLARFHSQLEAILGTTFDENSKTSAIAKLEQTMTAMADQQLSALRNAIDPGASESPLLVGRPR